MQQKVQDHVKNHGMTRVEDLNTLQQELTRLQAERHNAVGSLDKSGRRRSVEIANMDTSAKDTGARHVKKRGGRRPRLRRPSVKAKERAVRHEAGEVKKAGVKESWRERRLETIVFDAREARRASVVLTQDMVDAAAEDRRQEEQARRQRARDEATRDMVRAAATQNAVSAARTAASSCAGPEYRIIRNWFVS